MIVGIGVDLVDIPRFERTIERTPRLLERLFSPGERALPARSLAARYAAKEALIKALGGSDGVHWSEIEVTPEASGRPWFTLGGSTADVVAARGISAIHLSMTHDGGFAAAYVVAEGVGVGVGAGPLFAETTSVRAADDPLFAETTSVRAADDPLFAETTRVARNHRGSHAVSGNECGLGASAGADSASELGAPADGADGSAP